MSIDTKALIAATPATVALVRRELDKSRESQRGECSIPKAVKVDCAMVERLCRIAEKQADRLAALEAELASLRTDRDGAAEACRMLQEDKARLEQDNARLKRLIADIKEWDIAGFGKRDTLFALPLELRQRMEALAAGGDQ